MWQINCPLARKGCNGIYDEKKRRIIIFGGINSNIVFSDTWAYYIDKNSWKKIKSDNSPSARCNFSSIYYPIRNFMIIYGGFSINGRLGDLWAFDLNNNQWYEIHQGISMPKKRCSHSAIYDSKLNRMIIYGGTKSITRLEGSIYGDLWSLDLDPFSSTKLKKNLLELEWTNITPKLSPEPRFSHHSWIDEKLNIMYIFGGFTGKESSNDLWIFDLSIEKEFGWKKIKSKRTWPKTISENSAFIFNSLNNSVYFFSGCYENKFSSEFWCLNLDSIIWSLLPLDFSNPSVPSVRWKALSLYNNSDNTMVIYGGENNKFQILSDIYTFHFDKLN